MDCIPFAVEAAKGKLGHGHRLHTNKASALLFFFFLISDPLYFMFIAPSTAVDVLQMLCTSAKEEQSSQSNGIHTFACHVDIDFRRS